MTSSGSFPQGEIRLVSGSAFTLRGDDIDTDRIIPARFLKCVSFEALGDQVFADDRSELGGTHPFDQPGCGSSREHAPQALMRWGIRALIGVSFAEIFHGNCLALGIPCATATPEQVLALQVAVEADPGRRWTLNLEANTCSEPQAGSWSISLDPGAREMLLTGRWDATSQLVARDAELRATMATLPYLNGF